MAEKRIITWEGVTQAAHQIKLQIDRTKWRPHRIVAIGRGGLVPAGLLAYALDFSGPIESVAHEETEYEWMQVPSALFVDDITDTGKTLARFRKGCPNASFASLYYREGCLVKPDYIGITISKKSPWLTFPWAPNDGPSQGQR